VNTELDALKGALDRQREHVLGTLEGLAEEDLRRPVLPSGWSCLALLRHLSLDVERFWFPGVIAGDPDVAGQLTAGAEAHWYVPEGMSAKGGLRRLSGGHRECGRCARRCRARTEARRVARGDLADLAAA
jgi:hypothetical protein